MEKRSEEGATMVFIAVSMVSLLLVVSLVVDGGRAYAARRTAQNASDAAALAGAQALYSYQYDIATGASPAPSASTINAAVIAKLTQNKATGNQTCNFVNALGTTTGYSCSSGTTTGAAGVRVSGTITQTAALAPGTGAKLFTARGAATAAIQPLRSTSAPFIICGAANGSWPILDPTTAGAPATINVANAVAAGTQPVQAAKVGTCGAGSAFKGKAEPGIDIAVGQYAQGNAGNGYDGDIRDSVAGAVPCPPAPATAIDCDMLLPIADTGYGSGNGIYLHVVAFGIFRVTGNGLGNPKYYGHFVAPAAIATGGIAAAGQDCAVGSGVCLIKLIG